MARILRGLNSPFAPPVGGGVPSRFPSSSCGPPVSLWALFRPVGWGKFSDLQFLAVLSRFDGVSGVGWWCPSSDGIKWIYGAFIGLYWVVIISAPVPRLPAKGKKPFLSLSLLVSVLPSWPYNRQKKNGLCWVVSLGVVLWGFVSPIERKKGRLQAVCRFGLLPLFCLCLSASLLPWGLRCNINWLCRLHRCGLCNSM